MTLKVWRRALPQNIEFVIVPGWRAEMFWISSWFEVDLMAFDLDDDVVGAQARALRRRARRHVLHHRACCDCQPQRPLQRWRDVGQRDANETTRYPPGRLELGEHRDGLVDRQRKADARGLGADRRVDANHLAARVYERAAAIAEVDRGVGLDVVVQARVEELAPDEADDANRHRMHVPERVADGAHPLTGAQLVGVTQRRHRQIRGVRDMSPAPRR